MKHLKKDLLLLANKLIEKVPDPRNAKNTINHSKEKKTQNP